MVYIMPKAMMYETAESSHQKPHRAHRKPLLAVPPLDQSWCTFWVNSEHCWAKFDVGHRLTRPALMSVAAPIGKQPMKRLWAGWTIIMLHIYYCIRDAENVSRARMLTSGKNE